MDQPSVKIAAPTHISRLEDVDSALKDMKEGEIAIVQFTAVWCKKCHTLSEELKTTLGADGVLWLAVDVDDLPELATRFNVRRLPRFDVYANGKMKKTMESFEVSLEAILKAISDARTDTPPPPPVLELQADF